MVPCQLAKLSGILDRRAAPKENFCNIKYDVGILSASLSPLVACRRGKCMDARLFILRDTAAKMRENHRTDVSNQHVQVRPDAHAKLPRFYKPRASEELYRENRFAKIDQDEML